MVLRSVMPLKTTVDQILMERWRVRQPIVQANQDCNCILAPYRRNKGCCGESAKVFRTRRPVRIHYNRGLSNAESYAAFIWHAYDENEVVIGEGYQVSGGSFNRSKSTSSSKEGYPEQREINSYGSSLSTRPQEYMSDEDTSSNSGNRFENLTWD